MEDKKMKNVSLCLLFIAIVAMVSYTTSCTQPSADRRMTITTGSEKAKQLFKDAGDAMADGYLAKYRKLSFAALKEDSDFFMANYMLAITFHWGGNEKGFVKYATKAANCKSKLSREEIMLKEAVKKFLENRNADNSDIGEKLVKMFPGDLNAYFHLIWFKLIGQDLPGQIDALERTIAVFNDCAPVYNLLGYAYMNQGQDEKAAAAFDRYIQLRPDTPNPYDSKGDFYLKVKDYPKAYENFMKAHAIDSLWGIKKAIRVKEIMDSLAVAK